MVFALDGVVGFSTEAAQRQRHTVGNVAPAGPQRVQGRQPRHPEIRGKATGEKESDDDESARERRIHQEGQRLVGAAPEHGHGCQLYVASADHVEAEEGEADGKDARSGGGRSHQGRNREAADQGHRQVGTRAYGERPVPDAVGRDVRNRGVDQYEGDDQEARDDGCLLQHGSLISVPWNSEGAERAEMSFSARSRVCDFR